VQVALVFLLLSPPMDRYAPLVPPTSPERESRMSVILIGGSIVGALLVWAAVEAIRGDAAAVPLLTMACVFSVPLWRIERARDRNEARGHS